MQKIEQHSKNIKQQILAELLKAKSSIYLSVAWFTDHGLYNALYEKASEGIRINVLINDDEINNRLDFTQLMFIGANVYKIKETLMHDKSCIIDKKTIITGSFNWTYNASNNNIEKITIIREEGELAERNVYEFEEIIKDYKLKDLGHIEIEKIDSELSILNKRIISLSDKKKKIQKNKTTFSAQKSKKWETIEHIAEAADAKHGLIAGRTYTLWIAQSDFVTKSGSKVTKGEWFAVEK